MKRKAVSFSEGAMFHSTYRGAAAEWLTVWEAGGDASAGHVGCTPAQLRSSSLMPLPPHALHKGTGPSPPHPGVPLHCGSLITSSESPH